MTVYEMTRLPTLTDTTVERLKTAREENLPEFYALIASLRDNKWPLRAIADPLGVSRSVVSIWESKYSYRTPMPTTEPLPELDTEVKSVYTDYKIDSQTRQELYDLAREASKVRRYTDENASSRQAASKLEADLRYHKTQGASLQYLATICGVSRRAIAQRLEKTKDEA